LTVPDEDELFHRFFCAATAVSPYGWQVKAAIEGLAAVLPIPTGLGKTEGSVLAWAWRRLVKKDDEPLHLVYCLPMRSLVRQTTRRLQTCFARLRLWDSSIDVPVYQLIGGDADEEWAKAADRPWVLVGTQDMLLSRALNRGYGMSRFEWPVHFGLLNQDCHWIVDEVQLMGPGLWTTAQLDWMRSRRFPGLKRCRTTWMSATMALDFLQTTDRKRDDCGTIKPFDPDLEGDPNESLVLRRTARRPIKMFEPEKGKKAKPVVKQIASGAIASHVAGTQTLVICNTVRAAQDVFRSLDDSKAPKLLLTSRFQANDRQNAEETLQIFETRRAASKTGRVEDGDPGLICVSTQVIEAGLDISAHRLWTEHSPWPSLVQRLGRLNRDGKDNEAHTMIWKQAPENKRKHDGEDWVGPYRKIALDSALPLLETFASLSEQRTAADALDELQARMPKEFAEACAISPEPCPRALDVHGLFSTEPDLYGGFTDVSRFVRSNDPDADLTAFWRDWEGGAPPEGESLDGPPFNAAKEGCSVPALRLQEFLRATGARAWLWNDSRERWDAASARDLRPGMTVMLRGDVGGYSQTIGWTGEKGDRLHGLLPPGPGRALRDDGRAEAGYWSSLKSHLSDARSEAERICDGVGLQAEDPELGPCRKAVIEAAGLHDLGKAHPHWRAAVPSAGPLGHEVVAKFPRVLRIEVSGGAAEMVRAAVGSMLVDACALVDEVVADGKSIRLRWALEHALDRNILESVRELQGVRWAAHRAFRPGLRHEAASALAMWRQRKELNEVPYPALAVYLAAAHHGKVRTVLRAVSGLGGDVFGVGRSPEALQFDGRDWPMDFSVALDGAEGDWTEEGFVITGHGWTGLIADLLGPWRGNGDKAWIGVVPKDEPRALGPFALAWLEALVRIADWRASDHPSQRIRPKDNTE
jgi:CRISPR-associated endonuclease/helicase Cas3